MRGAHIKVHSEDLSHGEWLQGHVVLTLHTACVLGWVDVPHPWVG